MEKKKKLAVFFPGTGYHKDKPLFYYSRKIAVKQGFIWKLAGTGRKKRRTCMGECSEYSNHKGKGAA